MRTPRPGPTLSGKTRGELTSTADMLSWFRDDERELCAACRARAAVSLPETPTTFCLACGAITIDGRRIDVDLRAADVPC